ncbi:LysR family transcriptional regulator [Pseudomonas sp. BF-R-01]|jgi:DNA-binding transcriptional LysR family regulator|uniref:LysR family transcriptional regulator n=1 Tax=Pseudomonas sp. BF-R-01 TaxID=2832365 RepID=UPI001CC04D17|nr:LysR substrate-binding domain-containing protein [Pseudomonas sp. BF-R-01]
MARLDWYIRAGLKPRHLQLLVAIDDLGQLTKVAELLNVTQPAVSKALNELQTGLGLKLFDRTGRGLTPTAYGECLIRHARSILADLSVTGEELQALAAGRTSKVNLGALPAAAGAIVPRALALLQKESPGTSVFIREGSMDLLLQELRAGTIDLICGTLPAKRVGLDVDEKVLTEDNTVAVVGPQHPFAKRIDVTWSDLVEFPWVLPPSGSLLQAPLLATFRRHGVPLPSTYIETLSANVIQSFIHETDSIAFLSGSIASDYEQRGLLSILTLALPRLVRPVGVLWLAHRPPNEVTCQLVACMEKAAANMSPHVPVYDEPEDEFETLPEGV